MKNTLFSLCLIVLSTASSLAQINSENSVVGAMGNSGSAYIGGVLGLGVNASRLAAFEYQEKKASITLFPMGLSLSNSSINVNLYNALFGKDTRGVSGDKTEWTDADKQKLLDAVDGEFELNGRASVMLLGASYYHNEKVGAFGFHIIDHIGGRGVLNEEFLRYGLYGNTDFLGRTLGGKPTESNAFWYREYGLSYAREIPTNFRMRQLRPIESIKIGASVKWIAAHSFGELNDETSIYHSPSGDSLAAKIKYTATSAARGKLQDENSTESFSLFPESVGSGVGLDLGLSFNYRDWLSFGLSVNNIGVISFGSNTITKIADTTIIFTGLNDPISGTNNENQLDSLADAVKEFTRTNDGFSRALPTHLRLGAGLILDEKFPFPFALTIDYVQGFNNNFGNTVIPILGVGSEIRPVRQMPIRSGIQLGGRQTFAWALGIGYDNPYLAIDLNVGNLVTVFSPNNAKNLTFGLAIRGRFLSLPE